MFPRVMASVAFTIVSAALGLCQSDSGNRPANNPAKEFWNDKFRTGLPNVRREPSRLLVEAVDGTSKPGSALDLGCGEGRNLLYLAAKGWNVTGIDLSDEGIAQAKAAAQARNLTADFVVRDLDEYELGENRWDLISSIYMQDWHLKSKTNTFQRIKASLKTGGVVVIEGFGPPNGLNLDHIQREFSGFTVVRADVVATDPDWGSGKGAKRILRFIARKEPPASR
jgi:SAM-dependent methyltransferase